MKKRSQTSLRGKPILIAAGIFFTFSFLARLYFAGQSAAKNVEMKDLFAHKQALEQEVSRLRYDDLRLSSIAFIQEKAQQQGFVPMNNLLLSLDVSLSQPLALR